MKLSLSKPKLITLSIRSWLLSLSLSQSSLALLSYKYLKQSKQHLTTALGLGISMVLKLGA